MLNIDSITNGVVIDHIKAGKGMDIYNYLKLGQLDRSVAVIQNVRSSKYGKKDIIKIEGIIDIDMDALGYIDPNITIITVANDEVVDKKRLKLPEKLSNVIKCKNPRCITSIEQGLAHEFRLFDKDKKIYYCIYCEQEHK